MNWSEAAGRLRDIVRASAAMPPFNQASVALPLDVASWYTNLDPETQHRVDVWVRNTTGINPEYTLSDRHLTDGNDDDQMLHVAPTVCARCGAEQYGTGPCLNCVDRMSGSTPK